MNDSLNSEELARQLDEEMAQMEFNPDDMEEYDEGHNSDGYYNSVFGKSHTSFKSAMSNATVLT